MRQFDQSRMQAFVLHALLVAAAASSPFLPHAMLHAQEIGNGGVPSASSSGGGSVSSVFGRVGNVVPQSGDYTAAQVTNAAAKNAANTYSAVNTFPGGDLFYGGVNAQTGTSYAFTAADENRLVTFSNAAAIGVTLSQASTTGFTSGAIFTALNLGAGTVTITPAVSTINGAASLAITTGQSIVIYSDGTNYEARTAYAALTNQANNYSVNQILASGIGVQFNGMRNFIMKANTGRSFLTFSDNPSVTNIFSIVSNNTGLYTDIGVSLMNGQGCYMWSSTANSEGTVDTALCRGAAGVVTVSNSGNSTAGGGVIAAGAFESSGTAFTVSGCGTPTVTGGATYGTFAAGSGSCNPVITPGMTVPHGFICTLQDETTAAASFRQSAHSTTSATLTGTGVVSGDVIDVACGAF